MVLTVVLHFLFTRERQSLVSMLSGYRNISDSTAMTSLGFMKGTAYDEVELYLEPALLLEDVATLSWNIVIENTSH